MAEDFRISTSWRTNRKRKRLMRDLGPAAVIALEDLWSYAAAERTDGDLCGLSAQDIADEVDYIEDAQALVSVLIELRLLDKTDDGYRLHNWSRRQGWVAGESARAASGRASVHKRWHRKGKHAVKEPGCPLCFPDSDLVGEQSNLEGANRVAILPSDPYRTDPFRTDPENTSSEPSRAKPSEPPAEPPVITIPTNRYAKEREEYPVTQAQVDSWQETYPAVDVLQKLKALRQWSIDNPRKRKTKSGMTRFLGGRLAADQDKGGTRSQAPPMSLVPQTRKTGTELWLEKQKAKERAAQQQPQRGQVVDAELG